MERHDSRATLLDHTPDTLAAIFASWGEPGFRAKQVLEWVYQRNVDDYGRMTNLSKSLRERLSEALPILPSQIVESSGAAQRGLRFAARLRPPPELLPPPPTSGEVSESSGLCYQLSAAGDKKGKRPMPCTTTIGTSSMRGDAGNPTPPKATRQ